MARLQKLVPNLWFDSNAEEAVNYYTGIFNDASAGNKTYYGKAGKEIHKKEEGTVLTIEFVIEGQEFVALNAGNEFRFNESISFIINCDTQEEVDYYWDKLTPGGDPAAQVCGWLKDKYGLSWQIVPRGMEKWMTDKDPERSKRVMQAVLQMKKP